MYGLTHMIMQCGSIMPLMGDKFVRLFSLPSREKKPWSGAVQLENPTSRLPPTESVGESFTTSYCWFWYLPRDSFGGTLGGWIKGTSYQLDPSFSNILNFPAKTLNSHKSCILRGVSVSAADGGNHCALIPSHSQLHCTAAKACYECGCALSPFGSARASFSVHSCIENVRLCLPDLALRVFAFKRSRM